MFNAVLKNHCGVFQIIYNYAGPESEEWSHLEFVCEVAKSCGNMTLIIEEVDNYANTSRMPEKLRYLLKRGRHHGVSMIFVSRRPAEINRMITSQSQRFIIFKTFEPNDVRYLSGIIGADSRLLPNLKTFEYLVWYEGKIKKGVLKW